MKRCCESFLKRNRNATWMKLEQDLHSFLFGRHFFVSFQISHIYLICLFFLCWLPYFFRAPLMRAAHHKLLPVSLLLNKFSSPLERFAAWWFHWRRKGGRGHFHYFSWHSRKAASPPISSLCCRWQYPGKAIPMHCDLGITVVFPAAKLVVVVMSGWCGEKSYFCVLCIINSFKHCDSCRGGRSGGTRIGISAYSLSLYAD